MLKRSSAEGPVAAPPKKVFTPLSLVILSAISLWLIFDYSVVYSLVHSKLVEYPSTAATVDGPCLLLPPPLSWPTTPSRYNIPTSGNETHAVARKIWLEAEARYSSLMDDKFTIVFPTYKRPEALNTTLSVLLKEEIPSPHEIVIIWNDFKTEPPSDFTSALGVPIRHYVPNYNSLNNRFIPDPSYATQAIFHSDDDAWYEPSDLEFAFQVWRQQGRYRITGASPWCYSRDKNGSLSYTSCDSDGYSMISTNLAFVHIAFMDFYSSPWTDQGVYAIPTLLRQYVDDNFNCEDIAMNFIVSMLTCDGPLHVVGKEYYTHQDSNEEISEKDGYWAGRQRCMNEFEKVVGFFPLVQQMGSIQRGVPV